MSTPGEQEHAPGVSFAHLVLPCSRSAMDKLGERLKALGAASPEDMELLASILIVYDDALALVEERLNRLGVAPTTRVKTTDTIRDKLRLQGSMRLKGMQDLAGARIVREMDREEQDALGEAVIRAFADCPKGPSLVDRRVNPSFGYRALHVVVFPGGIPVEIQIRTSYQDSWAQLVEKLGDSWGRQIRYGGLPENPNRAVGAQITRADVWRYVTQAGDAIDIVETAFVQLRARMAQLEREQEKVADPAHTQTLDGLKSEYESSRQGLREAQEALETALDSLHALEEDEP